MTRLLRWPSRRLSSRVVAPFVGVLLLVQLAGIAAVHWGDAHSARLRSSRDLEAGERIWAHLLAQRAARLVRGASMLAADDALRSAAASGDTAALRHVLSEHGARAGAGVSALLAPDLAPRTLGAAPVSGTLDALRVLAPRLARQGSALALVGALPCQLVMVPIKAPQPAGYVVMGAAFDAALVQEMRALSGLDAAVLVRAAGGAERVALSSLPAQAADELPGVAAQDDAMTRADGAHRLRSIAQATAPGAAGVRTVLLEPATPAPAPTLGLEATLALISLGGLLLAGAAGLVAARQVTAPLRALAQASDRLGAGVDDGPMPHTGRADEIGALARSLERIAKLHCGLSQLAFRDPLTGLPNRARLSAALQSAIDGAAAGGQTPVSVVLLDLDRFKPLNDVLGHAFGDRLLEGIAQRLAGQSVREGDLVARLSGDEFALLLPGSDARAAQAVAERLADVFQLPMTLDDHAVDLGAGFGVASWPQHATDAETLLQRATVAMVAAKGRAERIAVYDPAIDAGSTGSLRLLADLRRALENDELRLFLQPRIALAGARLTGAEALVRWQHPVRGLVAPTEFVPLAEQTGVVRQLTRWMLEATARQWKSLRALGLVRVSVNLGARDLLDRELAAKLERIVARHRMPPQALCLEITERAVIDEPERAAATLNRLSHAGFALSIDDFGTGYSSLAYLKRLPLAELKIDRSFVRAMGHDEGDARIVRSTIDLAHNLGLTAVAEGVEDAATMARLAALGCDEAQGFHIGAPLPAAELAAFATRWSARLHGQPAPSLH